MAVLKGWEARDYGLRRPCASSRKLPCNPALRLAMETGHQHRLAQHMAVHRRHHLPPRGGGGEGELGVQGIKLENIVMIDRWLGAGSLPSGLAPSIGDLDGAVRQLRLDRR